MSLLMVRLNNTLCLIQKFLFLYILERHLNYVLDELYFISTSGLYCLSQDIEGNGCSNKFIFRLSRIAFLQLSIPTNSLFQKRRNLDFFTISMFQVFQLVQTIITLKILLSIPKLSQLSNILFLISICLMHVFLFLVSPNNSVL